MVVEEHRDHDPEETADRWHIGVVAPAPDDPFGTCDRRIYGGDHPVRSRVQMDLSDGA
jgi:hypothetical protein